MLRRPHIPGILLFAIAVSASAAPEEVLCDHVVHYTMDIRLNPQNHMISGKEIHIRTNTSEKSAEELWFRLYWNASRNNQSTFTME